MDVDNVQILLNVLSEEELNQIPVEISKKVEGFYEKKFEEFLTSKALCETAKSNIEQLRVDFEKQIEELTLKNQDETAKLHTSQQSVNELRKELDEARDELKRQQETVRRWDDDTTKFRRERNEAVNERDSLLNSVERKTMEVERLQSDVVSLEQKLKAANQARCEALLKLEEIQCKEVSLDFKEKRIEKELSLRDNQIQKLSDDLQRSHNELQALRREQNIKSLTIDTQLAQKTEELKIATSTIAHLNESNQELSSKAEDLATKLLAQNEETRKMMEHYRKELQSQSKLCDLYKDDCDDNKKQTEELGNAVTELKKMLNEASDSYGQLETQQKAIMLKHEKELENKDNKIQELKDELKNANDLLKMAKEENLDLAVEKLAPSAAATSRLIKSGMTLTELFTLYVKTAEDLQVEKKENSKLHLQIKNIVQELEERAPELTRQQNEYQNLKDSNEEMTAQLNKMIEENADTRSELSTIHDKLRYIENENKKLKLERSDLSRQVCHLLKEIEQMRGGYASEMDQSISSDMSANEVITKKLVTFSDIQELQENNVRLLLVVRDFSAKLEELEIAQSNMNQATYEAKIENYNKRLKEMQDTQEYQTQMMNQCLQQRDRYKKMYHDSMRSYGKHIPGSLNGSMSGDNVEIGDDDMPCGSNVSAISNETLVEKEKKITELDEKLKETERQLKNLKDEYENYRKEKLTNDKMMNEQFDAMRTEIREISSKNIKLVSTVEYNNEQIKIQQKNVATYKKQIQALEERNKAYETTIVKHEGSIMFLKESTLHAQTQLAGAEVMVENLKKECRILKDTESRLQTEREILNRERQNQSLLLNNLEMIKVSMERSETDGRMRVEARLDETSRECSALRRRLQEEQDRFRELTGNLERQMETAKNRMEEEIAIAETVQAELRCVREELSIKSTKCDELSKKLQESLCPVDSENPVSQANKRIRELEAKLTDSEVEIESLSKELTTTKEHVKQYCNMSESSEKELKELNDTYTAFKTQAEKELAAHQKKTAELTAELEEMKTEVSLKITGAQLSSSDSSSELHKAQLELKEALTKLTENNRDLREFREKCNTLSENLELAEQKYANEMIQHSSDIQQLSNLKEDMNKTKLQFDELKLARDQAIERLRTGEGGWNDREKSLNAEKVQLEERLTDLNSQNAVLLDQIQSLSTKLTISASAAADKDESMKDVSITDTSLLNKSISEEEKKCSDQLLQIIKYLRKEKDLAIAQFDILRSENVRVQSELMMCQKKLEESLAELNTEREKSETGVVTAVKHEEILRKLDTLNAITDSNRVLREERDTGNKKIKELVERLSKAEDELFPLQEKNREMSVKADSMTTEISSLRVEALKWRQRANLLVERSNKTSPEDWKRLQNDRENLAKLLTNEKDQLKKASDELASIKAEKSQLENDVANLTKQLGTSSEQNKKYAEELDVLRQAGGKMTTEIVEVKKVLSQREEELKKVNEDLGTKEEQLTDSKNKEIQIRKIAKRYKDSYIELKKQIDEKESAEKTDAAVGGESSNAADQEKNAESLEDLKARIVTLLEEIETLKKENETLQTKLEKEERNFEVLRDAKKRILSLTEANKTMTREINTFKGQVENIEKARADNDQTVAELKTQYEARISRIEKENADLEKENKDAIGRVTRENETLNMRLNQLNRQLGLQQVSKPTTSASGSSEKVPSESPRTANVKPMAGTSGQQSATVTPWRGSETPLASIRPMSVQPSSRTAAVLPTSQTSNVASVQGSPSNPSTSVTALVPPQQQVHTTAGNNNSNESMSSSPTSSHTDYMPATSSANVSVAAVPPMGSASTTAESSQQENDNSSAAGESSQALVSGGQQQAVALVSPRIENVTQNIAAPQAVEQNPAPSTSGTSSSNVQQISLHQASSSNTVTTTQAGHKRPRDVEGDSSTDNVEQQGDKTQPQSKRTRVQGETFQGVSESGLNSDVEYQVPTSSQRDQEDDVIIVDSDEEEEDEGMVDEGAADEGTAEADDGPFEGYEAPESYDQAEAEMENYDEGEGPDIDDDNVQSANNEVDVDDEDENEIPNQSGSSNNQVAPDAETSSTSVGQSSGPTTSDQSGQPKVTQQNPNEVQQIQSISSGSGEAGSSSSSSAQPSQTWRQVNPQQHLMLQNYEETSNDRRVPSTPTLYVTRRTDGFSEAVSSPHPQVPHGARFTFTESSARSTSTTMMPEGIDDTRMDLSQLDESGSRSVPTTPQIASPSERERQVVQEAPTNSDETQEQEPIPGPSHINEGQVPEISVTTADEEDYIESTDDKASTSEAAETAEDDEDDEQNKSSEVPDSEDGGDGVSSEGEKIPTTETIDMEEGSEAEVLKPPSTNTRSRATPRNTARRGARFANRGGTQRAPIVWQELSAGHSNRANALTSPSRGSFQQQQNQRNLRSRRRPNAFTGRSRF